MAILDGKTWMEILPEAECWRLLRLSSVGRLAVIVEDRPMIWPLNIAVHDRTIVFRTDPGTKVDAFQREPTVALEVDGLSFEDRRGWSVIAVGPVVELAGAELTQARSLPLAPWTVGDKPRWFGLRVTQLSGREIGDRAAAAGDPAGRRR